VDCRASLVAPAAILPVELPGRARGLRVEPGEQLVEVTVAARQYHQDEFQRPVMNLDRLLCLQVVQRQADRVA
jgi:hypothetical protein